MSFNFTCELSFLKIFISGNRKMWYYWTNNNCTVNKCTINNYPVNNCTFNKWTINNYTDNNRTNIDCTVNNSSNIDCTINNSFNIDGTINNFTDNVGRNNYWWVLKFLSNFGNFVNQKLSFFNHDYEFSINI